MIPTSWQSFLDQTGKASWLTSVRTKRQTNIPRAYRLGKREKNVSMPLMVETEAAGKGYAKEAMRKWGHGTRSSGQLSKPMHFHVKRRERCGLIPSHVLRTWAKLGTEFSDLPLWTHFFCFLQLLWVPVFMLRAKIKIFFYNFFWKLISQKLAFDILNQNL